MDGQDDILSFVGRFDVPVDVAGAFPLPEEWRFMAMDGVYLVPDPCEKCLLLLTKETWDNEVALLKRSHDSDAPILLDQITKNGQEVSIDEDGRILIPIALRTQVGIASNASLLGCIRVIKIWATDVLAESEKKDTILDFIEAVMKE